MPNSKAALIQYFPCPLQQQALCRNIFSLCVSWCCTPLWIKYPPNVMQPCSKIASTHFLIDTQMDVMAQGNPNIIKSMKVGRAGDLCFTQQTLGTYLTIFLFLNKWAMLQKSYLMGVSLLCLCRVACYISHLIQKDTKKLTLRWSLKSGNSNAKAIDPSSVVSVLK